MTILFVEVVHFSVNGVIVCCRMGKSVKAMVALKDGTLEEFVADNKDI